MPKLPEVPKVPAVPQTPSLPSVPGVTGGGQGAPSVPAPPSVPSTGGGIGDVTGRGGAPTPGGSGSAGSVAQSGAGTTAAGGSASADTSGGRASGGRGSGGGAARERNLRRKVRSLEPCLDAVSSLERRVLVLRSGLGDARPHSRRATAQRLGISVERATRAERRGLRGIASANRATGCGYGGSGGGSAGGGFAEITAIAPLVAELLGLSPPASAGRERARPDEAPAFTDGPTPAEDLAEAAAEGAATAAAEGGAFPFLVLLALVAMLLATAVVLRGRRVAGDVLDRRAEDARERRHEELVTAVRNILGERQHR